MAGSGGAKAAMGSRCGMAGESAVRCAVLGAGRNQNSNHHERDRGEMLHAVILRLFQENAQRNRKP